MPVDILELIARSEWPVVVGGAFLLFRGPIRELIGRINLTKIDAFGFKAEFERGLAKVESLTPAKDEKPKPKIAMDEKIAVEEPKAALTPARAKGASPDATVLDAWSWLEADMRAMIDAIHPRHTGVLWTPPLKIDEAAREFGLSEDEVQSLMVLRNLRNSIAHSASTSITWDDAIRFKQATERLLARMRKNWEERRKPPRQNS
jgi:hypothetical protein